MKLSPKGELAVFRDDAGRANGNLFDRSGRLVTCVGAEFGPGGRRRLVRTDLRTGEVAVLTDQYQGKRYNSPNDLCIDSRGNIYFTDPRYGDQSDRDMDVEAVYRLDTAGKARRLLSQPEVQKPNGIAIAPDDRTLYLVDSNPLPGGNRKIWSFTLDESGSPSSRRLVYDFGAGRGGDGMRLDMKGNLWIAAGINDEQLPPDIDRDDFRRRNQIRRRRGRIRGERIPPRRPGGGQRDAIIQPSPLRLRQGAG